MTPLQEIATLKIGSRPASRTTSDRIEDLRAIPWVFSWAQARVMLPGWYGAGQALAAFEDRGLLREMAAGLAVLPHDARQHGDGAGQVRHADRAALPRSWWRTETLAQTDLRPHSRGLGADTRLPARDHRPVAAAGEESRAGCVDPAAPALHRAAEPAAGGADRSAIARAKPIRASRKASSCRSTPWPRRCATAGEPDRSVIQGAQ